MNNYLLRGLLGATVCLVAGSAFAQTTETATLGVSNDVTLTTDSKDKANSTEKALEMYTTRTDGKITREYLGLMSFQVPAKAGYVVKSATLKLVTERAKGTLAIYGLGAEVSDADTYNSQIDNINAARENEPIAKVSLKGTAGKAVTDEGASSKIEDWVNIIDITDYVKAQANGHVNLLLLNDAASTPISIKVYTSDATDVTNTKVTPNFTFAADELKPQLTLEYEEIQNHNSKVLTPTADTWIRKNNKTNQAAAINMELQSCTNSDVSMLGLMSFDLPKEVLHSNYEVSNANLRLVTKRIKGDRMVNVYKYDVFEENTVYETESEKVAGSMVEANLLTTFKVEGKADADITSDEIVNTQFSNIDKWTTNVDMTEAVKGLSDTKFNILLAKQKDEAKSTQIFTKDAKDFENTKNTDTPIAFAAADLVPQLTVDYALATHTLKVTEAGAATLVLPYETDIPEGVKAYTLTYTSGNNAVATEVKNVIPANTPVLINANKGDYTFKATATLTTKAANPVSGNLHGVWNKEVVPVGSYVLQNQSGTVAFYRVESEGFNIKANQAYLSIPVAVGAKMLNIDFSGEATAINGVEAAAINANAQVYTIDGKKANRNNLAKGQLYITKGKTFILK